MMMRCGMIEKLRERDAKLIETGPVEIAKDNALPGFVLRGFNQAHLRGEVAPRLAVVNETIYPRPKLRIHRIVQVALPPKVKRQVRIQMRKNDAGEQIR